MRAGNSEVAQIVWPPLHNVATAPLPSLMAVLERIDYQGPQEIAQNQWRQLMCTHGWHWSCSEAYRQHAKVEFPHSLSELPLTSRQQLQQQLFTRRVYAPPEHGPFSLNQTSGSTGEPVRVVRSQVNQLFWFANNLQEHRWWRRGFHKKLGVVRANFPAERLHQSTWGPPASIVTSTGPSLALSMQLSVEQIASELESFAPEYISLYPSLLQGLLDHWGGSLPWAELEQIRTLGESLPEQLANGLGVPVVDSYSSQEVGSIAIQCPEERQLHVCADHLIVEVLDAAGNPCLAGDVGRVVVSDLHNFSTPVIRYETGDYAEAAGPCGCGRQTPVLGKILGRTRNLLTLPDGQKRWPTFGFASFRDIAPVLQYQVVQTELFKLELHLYMTQALSNEQQSQLAKIVCSHLGATFDIKFVVHQRPLPRGAGGKFEEFRSELPI